MDIITIFGKYVSKVYWKCSSFPHFDWLIQRRYAALNMESSCQKSCFWSTLSQLLYILLSTWIVRSVTDFHSSDLLMKWIKVNKQTTYYINLKLLIRDLFWCLVFCACWYQRQRGLELEQNTQFIVWVIFVDHNITICMGKGLDTHNGC